MIFVRKKLFFILIFYSFFFSKVKAQDYVLNYEHITTKQGLSNNFITCIIQDSVGFMWFGTQDGLCRYDGNSYTTYKTNIEKKHILLSNNITALAILNDSIMYVGTEAGLHLFNFHQNTITPIKKFRKKYISQIIISSDNFIWVVESKKGIYKRSLKESEWTNLYDKYPPLNSNFERGIAEKIIDKKPEVLIIADTGQYEKGLGNAIYQIEKEALKFSFYETNIYIETIHDNKIIILENAVIYKDLLNIKHKNTDLEIVYINSKQKQQYKRTERMAAIVYKDKLYTCLATTLLIIDLKTYKIIKEIELSETSAKQNNLIKNLFIDKTGNLWVTTFGQGVLIFPTYALYNVRGYRYDINNPSKELSEASVRAIYKDTTTKATWIQTYSIKRIIDIFWQDSIKKKLLLNAYTFSIKEDKKDKNILWMATYGSILKVKKYPPKIIKSYFTDSLPKALEVITDSTILFADTKYVYIFNTKKEIIVKKIAVNHTAYLYQDKNKLIWIGTKTDGFASWNIIDDKITYYNPEKNSIVKTLHVKCIYEDTRGMLWIATTSGIYSFDKKTKQTKKFDETTGLPSNVVYGILEDDNYNLWLSTNHGISKFDIENKNFTNFDVNDGLQDDEYNTQAFYKSKDGEMFFGGIKGVDAFFPNDLKRNEYIPNILLTGFKYLGKDVKTDAPISTIKEITLPSDSAQMLTFEFAALNFYQSKRNKYAYKIEEIDTTWIQLENKNELTLTSLAAGNYTLRIKGSNNHGLWNEEGLTLKINIIPPFWQQNWFLLSLLVLFLTGVYSFYKVRIYQVNRREEILEAQIKERTKELATANRNKDQLFAIIAHDLRSPLTAFEDISNQIEYFIRKNKLQRLIELGRHIDTSIQGLNILLNNLLGWALIQQNNKIQINPQLMDLSEMVERTLSIYKNVAQSNQINLKNFVKPNIEITVDIDSFQTILRNLISNALKYTPPNGTIILQTLQTKENVTLVIQDTGVGMNEEQIKAIFEPNSIQSNRGIRGEKGTGLGLALCQEFAILNNIKMEAESHPNEGTIFYLIIPTS